MKKSDQTYNSIRANERPIVDLRSFTALILEFSICTVVIAVTLYEFTLPLIAIAICILATRQHALLMLYHDAVHGLIARNRRLNDLIINIFIGIPLLMPVHVYRRFHLSHHASFGTHSDPERILLYRWQPWNYRPLPWTRLLLQIMGDLLLINMILTGIALLREQLDPHSQLRLAKTSVTPETLVLIAMFVVALGLWAWHYPDVFWKVALLWFGTIFTFTHVIQKIRSFAEHGPLEGDEVTYSWRPGLLGRLVLWPYNINYHREHHEHPGIPWHALPEHFGKRSSGRSTGELLDHLLAPVKMRESKNLL